MHTSLRMQGAVAILAFFAVLSVSWDAIQARLQDLQNTPPPPRLANMGVEHKHPLGLRLEYATKSGSALLQITHEDGNEIAMLSLPESWKRQEVRGARLPQVQPDTSSFGFTRWPLPPQASFQFWLPRVPKNIIVHNPGGSPLKIELVRLDLQSNAMEEDVLLLHKDATTLW